MAISLAGWLHDNFKIRAFIDSCIWGYSAILQKQIDERYCKHEDDNYYDYNKRNYSTSHVHMMLSSALHIMIDKFECLFFLNTPNSTRASSAKIDNEREQLTASPWIYSEIATSQIIRKTAISNYRKNQIVIENFALEESKQDYLYHTMPINHLTKISLTDLRNWEKSSAGKNNMDSLDDLYSSKPEKDITYIKG